MAARRVDPIVAAGQEEAEAVLVFAAHKRFGKQELNSGSKNGARG